jgi:hypothetical protein
MIGIPTLLLSLALAPAADPAEAWARLVQVLFVSLDFRSVRRGHARLRVLRLTDVSGQVVKDVIA